jgi:hypothetical protein
MVLCSVKEKYGGRAESSFSFWSGAINNKGNRPSSQNIQISYCLKHVCMLQITSVPTVVTFEVI